MSGGTKKGIQWKRIRTTRKKGKYEVKNVDFAKEDKVFIESCEKAGVTPTSRQASKYRNKKGKAYKFGKNLGA